jgi:hypothetical protein
MYPYASHPVGPTTQQTRVLEVLIAFRHNWEGGLPEPVNSPHQHRTQTAFNLAFNRLNSTWKHLTGNNNLKIMTPLHQKLEDKNQKSPKKAEVV